MLSISAIVPNFNHSKYLRESIRGIADQSCPATEIIIIDDASTDDSWDILQAIKTEIPRIQILRNEKNMGPYRTALKGIMMSKGVYLALCAADDILFPNAFEEYSKIASDGDQHIGICTSDPVYFEDIKPYMFARHQVMKLSSSQIFTSQEVIRNSRKYDFNIFSTASLYRKEVFLKYGYDESLNCFSDFYLNSVIALNHSVAYVPKGLAAFRVMPLSYSQRAKKNFSLRTKSAWNFFQKLSSESIDIRTKFKESGILSCGGYFFLLFLLLHPKHFHYIPSMLHRIFRKKLKSWLHKPEIILQP